MPRLRARLSRLEVECERGDHRANRPWRTDEVCGANRHTVERHAVPHDGLPRKVVACRGRTSARDTLLSDNNPNRRSRRRTGCLKEARRPNGDSSPNQQLTGIRREAMSPDARFGSNQEPSLVITRLAGSDVHGRYPVDRVS